MTSRWRAVRTVAEVSASDRFVTAVLGHVDELHSDSLICRVRWLAYIRTAILCIALRHDNKPFPHAPVHVKYTYRVFVFFFFALDFTIINDYNDR